MLIESDEIRNMAWDILEEYTKECGKRNDGADYIVQQISDGIDNLVYLKGKGKGN